MSFQKERKDVRLGRHCIAVFEPLPVFGIIKTPRLTYDLFWSGLALALASSYNAGFDDDLDHCQAARRRMPVEPEILIPTADNNLAPIICLLGWAVSV